MLSLREASGDEAISRPYSLIAPLKSNHFGFNCSINAIFFCRDPALICFSRKIADSAESQTSK